MRRLTPYAIVIEVAALAVPAQVVMADDYLTVGEAQRAAYPQADRFEPIKTAVTADQLRGVAALAGPQPAHGRLQIWRAFQASQPLGFFFVDEVVGRQDLITYALAIDNDGKLGEVEILTYRESHGGEVRNAAWRRQFAGRKQLEALRVAIDIKNIAGATLSSEHITQGARWLLALWQTTLSTFP
jgi:hypothetical protein